MLRLAAARVARVRPACGPLSHAFSSARAVATPRVGQQALALTELRLVCEAGKQLGVLPPAEALKIAAERAVGLVEVSPQAKPCVPIQTHTGTAHGSRTLAAAGRCGGLRHLSALRS